MIAVNDEQEIFYTDMNDSLYVVNLNGEITQIDPYVASINFNRNKTECMVFSNDAGRVYKDGKVINIDGLCDNVIDEIVCPTATSVVASLNFYHDVYQYDIDSFANKYYLTYEGSLIEIGSDYHIYLCISYDISYFVYDDALLYINDNCIVEEKSFEEN